MQTNYIIGLLCFALVALMVILGLDNIGLLAKPANPLREQNPAAYEVPDLSLETLAGETFSLTELQGKVVLLNFWASWCPPCLREFPLLIATTLAYPEELRLVAISNDHNQTAMLDFIANLHGLEENPALIKLVWDPTATLSQQVFNTVLLPETYLIDQRGKIISKIAGEVTRDDLQRLTELFN